MWCSLTANATSCADIERRLRWGSPELTRLFLENPRLAG